jgi:hypothetical protein
MSYSAPFPMRSAPRAGFTARLGPRLFAVAAVVGITMLGNLRLQASEVRQPAVFRVASSDDPVRVPLAGMASAETVRTRSVKAPADVPSDPKDDAEDAAHVVPAIYAWDPDVRFVYFRHVSKWM